MPVCKKCNAKFPNRKVVDGKERYLHHRKYCLECSPLGTRRFCGPIVSPEGRLKGRSVGHKCRVCGKAFVTKHADLQCTACKSEKQREKKRRRGIEYLGGKCQICGYNDCPAGFDFHHMDPKTKELNLGENWEKSWDILKKELDKCKLLCCRCHREWHYAQNRNLTDQYSECSLSFRLRLKNV